MSLRRERIVDICRASAIHMKSTSYDMFKYNFKIKHKDYELVEKSISLILVNEFDNERDLIFHFGLMAWKLGGIHIGSVAEKRDILHSKQSLSYLMSPVRLWEPVLKLAHNDIGEIVKESGDYAAPLLKWLIGGKISLLEFTILVSLTSCSNSWKSYLWNAHKDKILKCMSMLQISKEELKVSAVTLKTLINKD